MRVLGEWLLTPWRAAVHEPTRTAVVADLHLGYDQARRDAGEAVPVMDWDEFMAPLGALARTQTISWLVIAGDLFEKAFCHAAWAEFRDRVQALAIEIAGLVPG